MPWLSQGSIYLTGDKAMGYETYHDFNIEGEDPSGLTEEEHIKAIESLSEYSCLFRDCCKWYDESEDMTKYSLLYPTTIFVISGEGEENGDLWEAYFLNGKMQMCKAKIEYDTFDEAQMQ